MCVYTCLFLALSYNFIFCVHVRFDKLKKCIKASDGGATESLHFSRQSLKAVKKKVKLEEKDKVCKSPMAYLYRPFNKSKRNFKSGEGQEAFITKIDVGKSALKFLEPIVPY